MKMKALTRRIHRLGWMMLCLSTLVACGEVPVDETAYFEKHGHFYSDPSGPRFEGFAEFLQTPNDIAVEIYAGSDIASTEILARQIVEWFRLIQDPDFPVNVEVRTVTSSLASQTIIATFFIDGAYGWETPETYNLQIENVYKRARTTLPHRFTDMAVSGKIWAKFYRLTD